MANPYFNNTQDILPLTKARAANVEANFDAVGVGFDGVDTTLTTLNNKAVKAPAGETLVDLPAAGSRANKGLVFDATGQPAVQTIATDAQMTAAQTAATNAANSAAAAASSQTAAAASAASAAASASAGAPTLTHVTTATVAMVAGGHYSLEYAGVVTATGPAVANAGDTIYVSMENGRLDNVFDPNGLKVKGQTGTRTFDMGLYTYQLRYLGAADGWVLL